MDHKAGFLSWSSCNENCSSSYRDSRETDKKLVNILSVAFQRKRRFEISSLTIFHSSKEFFLKFRKTANLFVDLTSRNWSSASLRIITLYKNFSGLYAVSGICDSIRATWTNQREQLEQLNASSLEESGEVLNSSGFQVYRTNPKESRRIRNLVNRISSGLFQKKKYFSA